MSLNLETAKALVLAEIEKEGEDFIYKSDEREKDSHPHCLNYEPDGTPSCLVGRALDAGGIITFDDAISTVSVVGDDVVSCGIIILSRAMDLDIEKDALDFLHTLQYHQDFGKPWGAAYKISLEDPFDSENW